MDDKGWGKTEIKTTEELPENGWALGYFHSSHYAWDGKTWSRNFYELMKRDLLLFTLGDLKGKKILEIGCGEGIYLDIIARQGGVIFGQDISSERAAIAAKKLKENFFDVDIKIGDAAELLFSDNYFDAVIAADFLEHVTYEEKKKIVAEAYRVLKPGGIFAIKTPNLSYLKISLLLRRMVAIFRFRSPFCIEIPHTNKNPDNQHCGLTTYDELEAILLKNMFHSPIITYFPLYGKRMPRLIARFLYGKKKFCEQIIMTARKPLFLGFYP